MKFWKDVRREVLTGELSQRAACRKYGLGWHTLKKILAHDAPPGYRQKQPRRKRRLEPFGVALPPSAFLLPLRSAASVASTRSWKTTARRHASSGTRRIGSSSGCGMSTATPAARRW
jgi:hypothetical protein